uniref:Tudor domain-containing protein n=1 Tax=Peronospora matthiolae TaxID=2874970 RepID=A0AAV1TQ53_9STRA
MSADASLEELEARLVTFTEQLQNIQELLQSDETNEEFLSIAKDLVEVIELTKETIDLKVNKTLSVVQDLEPQKIQECRQELPLLEIEFEPDTAVEALQQGVWYPAHVDSVTSDGHYNVTFLGFGTSAALQQNELRAIFVDAEEAARLPAKESITDGFKCRAKYYADAVVYSCSVTKVTPLGFQVLFDGYGNSEEVPYEYLRPAAESPQTVTDTGVALTCTSDPRDGAAAAALVPKVAPAVIHKPIKVPENLQILPSDTEAEKERKRKRLRAIKSLNRHKNIDNERNIKQHDWKAFQHKAKKKGIKKGVSGVLSKRGSSMFASPQTVEGRVGVMGSGQGMTNFPDARNKKSKHT